MFVTSLKVSALGAYLIRANEQHDQGACFRIASCAASSGQADRVHKCILIAHLSPIMGKHKGERSPGL